MIRTSLLGLFLLPASLLAQNPGPKPPGPFDALFPMLMVGLIFYFLMIRPAQKRQKQAAAMVAALKKGDQVVTAGGIHGIVSGVQEDTVTLKIADNVKIRLDKGQVARLSKAKEGGNEDNSDSSSDSTDEKEDK